MLHVSMLYRYTDIMMLILLGCILVIIGLKISIIWEERKKVVRVVPDMVILNNTTDAAAAIKTLLLVPGTDFLYVPVYYYYKNGVEHTTLSYRKCRYETRSIYKRKRV